MTVSEKTFRQLALADPDGFWELYCGQLRQKPGMTAEHNDSSLELAVQLRNQLERSQFRVRGGQGHVRRSAENYFIPDVFVIPADVERRQRGTRKLEYYTDPLPLIVEVWSPSTGDYDIEVKLAEYQRRGDLEIWQIHPFDRVVTTWVRQPDGSYLETLYTDGVIKPTALPGVSIDIASLFD